MIKWLILILCFQSQAGSIVPFPLENYENPTEVTQLTEQVNLSGITYNWIADEYITVHQNSYCRLDNQLNELFCGPLDCGDCEDIIFMGLNGAFYEYALVEEGGAQGSVIIVQAPVDTHILRFDEVSFQKLTYAPTVGGDSGEGVAYDPVNNIIYICIEDPNMQVLSFTRPSHNDDASYENGSLTITESLSTKQLASLLGPGADLSSCYFHESTGRLWLMSHIAHNISDVDLSGNLIHQLELPIGQVEGFTFNNDFNELIVVSEPRHYQIYFATDKIFSHGFE